MKKNQQQRKILFLQLYGGGKVIGGTEVYLKNLLKILSDRDPHTDKIVATLNSVDNIFVPYAQKVVDVPWTRFIETWTIMKLQYQHNLFGLVLLPWSVLGLVASGWNQLKNNRNFIIYANGGQVAAVSAYILHKLSGVSYILHFHGTFNFPQLFLDMKIGFFAQIMRAVVKRSFDSSSYIIANSKDCYLDITKARGTAEKTAVVRCFVDEDLFQPVSQKTSRKKLRLPSDEFTIISTNRLEEGKHISLLLDAFSKIKSEKVRLIIIGDGPLRSRVMELTQIDHRVTYLSKIINDQLPLYLSAADLAWGACSVYYMSLTQVEALACGIPVMSSNIPAPLDTKFAPKVHPATIPSSVGFLVKHDAGFVSRLLDRLSTQRDRLQKMKFACRRFYDLEYGRTNRERIWKIIKDEL